MTTPKKSAIVLLQGRIARTEIITDKHTLEDVKREVFGEKDCADVEITLGPPKCRYAWYCSPAHYNQVSKENEFPPRLMEAIKYPLHLILGMFPFGYAYGPMIVVDKDRGYLTAAQHRKLWAEIARMQLDDSDDDDDSESIAAASV